MRACADKLVKNATGSEGSKASESYAMLQSFFSICQTARTHWQQGAAIAWAHARALATQRDLQRLLAPLTTSGGVGPFPP